MTSHAASTASHVVPTFPLMGHRISLFDKSSFLATVAARVASGRRTVFSHVNLHSLAALPSSPKMEALFDRPETFVHIDGMPVVALARMSGAKATKANRLAAVDFAEDLMALAADSGWKVAYVGSDAATVEKVVERFVRAHPGLRFRAWDGFFDMEDRSEGSKLSATLAGLSSYAPDLLFVGMGQPRQEAFLQDNLDLLPETVAIPVGAMFEYFVGMQSIPPRWLGDVGLEWAYRLAGNPRRLAHRYLVEPFQLAARAPAYTARRSRSAASRSAPASYTVS